MTIDNTIAAPQITIDWEKYGHLIKEKTIPAKTILLNKGIFRGMGIL